MTEPLAQSLLCSLDIKGSKWSSEISEELRDSNGVDSSGAVNIIVSPGLVIFVLESEVFLGFSPTFGEVGAEDLEGSISSSSLGEVERSSWLWVLVLWVGDSLNSVLGEHVLGESVNWVVSLISGISDKDFSLWHDSLVWIHKVSKLIDGSWELLHMWMPSVPVWEKLKNLTGLDVHGIVEFLLVSSRLKFVGLGGAKKANKSSVLHF